MRSRTTAVTPGFEDLEGRRLLGGMDPGLQSPSPPILTSRDDVGQPPSNPGQITGVTDPSIIKQGNTYYVFSTGPGIPIRVSNDLIHWEQIGQAFGDIPAWAKAKVPGASEFWAPAISFFNGEYHLFYAVSTFGSNRSVIGLATNKTLDPTESDYHWVDRGEVIESRPGRNDWNAIDPNIVVDSHSHVWLTFGSQWSGIQQLRINPGTGKPSGHAPRLYSLASRPASGPIEAPYIVHRNGYYYLFVSFNLCCMGADSTYKIMAGRSKAVTGPYLDRDGKPMTRGGGTLVLASSDLDRGPGHNSVLSDGGRDWIVYHTYDAQNGGTPMLQIRPLQWSEDGWPVAGQPLF